MPTQMPSTGRPPARRRPMISSPWTARRPAMHAANAPTPGTTRPSASIAACRSADRVDLGTGALEGAHDRAEVARAVVEDGDRWRDAGVAWCSERALGRGHAGLARVERDRVAQRPGDGLELRLDDVVRVATREHPHVQGDLGVVSEGLEDVPGQRPEVGVRRCRTNSCPSGSPTCTQ